jgi:hypothetical protein
MVVDAGSMGCSSGGAHDSVCGVTPESALSPGRARRFRRYPSQTDDIMTAKMIIDATRPMRRPFSTRLLTPLCKSDYS